MLQIWDVKAIDHILWYHLIIASVSASDFYILNNIESCFPFIAGQSSSYLYISIKRSPGCALNVSSPLYEV